MKKRISILGATGSIGTQTVEIVSDLGLEVVAMTTNKNVNLLAEQARKLQPKLCVAFEETAAKELKCLLADTDIAVMAGMDGLIAAATHPDCETVVTAVVGMVGLLPTLAAIRAGKTIALANKETLVCAGELVMQEAARYGVSILPVDSEHSAIFQCMQACQGNVLDKIILTASGGPFFGKSEEALRVVTRAQALQHPNWSMGAKITIDSATLMNKGLELLEAMWLYGVPENQIEVVVHRESIVHSCIAFADGSILAQLGVPDMRLPIQYALTYPERLPCKVPALSLTELGKMTFYPPDVKAFPALRLARQVAVRKGTLGAVFNGANEAAVSLFLQDKIPFWKIPVLVEYAMQEVAWQDAPDLDTILLCDQTAREVVQQAVHRK